MRDHFEARGHSRTQLRSLWGLLPLILLVLLPQNGAADPSETIAHALARHHIELTKPALVEALRNPDKEVRGLAAWELLEMKANDSLPQILQAMRDEKDPATEVNLASAAAHFGANEGTAELVKVCGDPALPGSVRVDAARHLFDLKDRSCMSDLLKLINSASDGGTRETALNLVSQRPDLTKLEIAQMMPVSLEMLRAKEPHFRYKGAVFLSNLGDPNAISYLRTAIQVEPEESVKSQMQRSLDTLLSQKLAP
ncbi:MAG TPA: HEAT repeat domain-containing protein [Acidobacteriaceae bacterium]|jgi:HEAT repeat protein|nr:HEAT repeat domain-containing protein [Acidobacteriaceae bacterium]